MDKNPKHPLKKKKVNQKVKVVAETEMKDQEMTGKGRKH